MRCRNTLVNFRRKLRLQLLDLAVEALDGLLVRGFLFLALADSAHQLFDLVRRVACGSLPAVAERHLQSWLSKSPNQINQHTKVTYRRAAHAGRVRQLLETVLILPPATPSGDHAEAAAPPPSPLQTDDTTEWCRAATQTATQLYGMRQLALPETPMRAQSAEARRAAPCLYHHGRGLRRQQRCAGVLGTAILSEPNVCVCDWFFCHLRNCGIRKSA